MSVEIIVRPTLGSYTARAKGHKETASRSEGVRQAAEALVRKLALGAGQLLERTATDLPQGQQRFHFIGEEPAEQHQGEPAKNTNRLCHLDYTDHPYRCGCLKGDEEAQRIYDEHYSAGEVERLRALRLELRKELHSTQLERDTLRAQLADLKRRHDGLHRDMATIAGREVPMGCTVADYAAAAIADALFTSAEPSVIACQVDESCGQSVPVELDERAAFEAAWGRLHKNEGKTPFLRIEPLGNYRWGDVHEGWLMWQARAALETHA